MKEEWRSVVGYEGLYEVSSMGRVRSVAHISQDAFGRLRAWAGKELILMSRDGQYLNVGLHKSGNQATARVHILVAAAFIGPCPAGYEVNHKDLCKKNNQAANLEYVTRKSNVVHGRDNGAWINRLRPIIRSDGKLFESIAAAARELGMSGGSNINRVLRGEKKKCHGYGFVYAD